jgi:hypothetical protein
MDRVEQLRQIQSDALELFTKKNADYGDAFAKFGLVGVLMRIEDKIQRALSISKSGIVLVDDEGIKDTLLDLHNYAAMALMLL